MIKYQTNTREKYKQSIIQLINLGYKIIKPKLSLGSND